MVLNCESSRYILRDAGDYFHFTCLATVAHKTQGEKIAPTWKVSMLNKHTIGHYTYEIVGVGGDTSIINGVKPYQAGTV